MAQAPAAMCQLMSDGDVRITVDAATDPAMTECVARCDYTGAGGMSTSAKATVTMNRSLSPISHGRSVFYSQMRPNATNASAIKGGTTMCRRM